MRAIPVGLGTLENLKIIGDKCGGFLDVHALEGDLVIPRVRIAAADLWTMPRVLPIRLVGVTYLVIIKVDFNTMARVGKSSSGRQVEDEVGFDRVAPSNLDGGSFGWKRSLSKFEIGGPPSKPFVDRPYTLGPSSKPMVGRPNTIGPNGNNSLVWVKKGFDQTGPVEINKLGLGSSLFNP